MLPPIHIAAFPALAFCLSFLQTSWTCQTCRACSCTGSACLQVQVDMLPPSHCKPAGAAARQALVLVDSVAARARILQRGLSPLGGRAVPTYTIEGFKDGLCFWLVHFVSLQVPSPGGSRALECTEATWSAMVGLLPCTVTPGAEHTSIWFRRLIALGPGVLAHGSFLRTCLERHVAVATQGASPSKTQP